MQKPEYIIELEKQAGLAVEQLREEHFEKGLPFMVGNMDLPKGQFYLEFSDGKIVIATFPENQRDYQILKSLSENQSQKLRETYNLFPCPIYI
jgi:hypothetical protein